MRRVIMVHLARPICLVGRGYRVGQRRSFQSCRLIRGFEQMREHKYKVGEDFFISSPNLGDGEVRAITFRHPDIILKIYVPHDGITFSIELEKVSSFSLNTDHPQNVIDGIRVYPNRESMRLTHKNLVAGLPPTTLQAQEEVIVLVEPITGSDLVCTCKALRIFLDD
jgi:hypothetical protein